MLANHIFLAAGWILYCLIHSVLAHRAFKMYAAKLLGKYSPYYRLGYNLLAFVLLAVLLFFQVTLPSVPLFDGNSISQLAGCILSASGLIIMILCILKYFGGLSGLKGVYIEEASSTLYITGLHRFVRHPLYLGTFLFIWGLLLIIPVYSLLIMDVIVTIYTLIGIKLEEVKLVHQFGDQYREYRMKVPMILPFFRKYRGGT